MSKIARVKFIRDKEPSIKALTAENKVLDGALYVATDTGTLWMGISSSSLIQIKDNINTNTTYTLTKSGSTITLKGSDGSSVNVTDSNTIYNNATVSVAGLMSAADKSKLDSVATGANKTVVDASFVANSTNPVQSKVVKSALDGKSDTGHTHDDRYYTESEINTQLNAKANSSHTHTKSQITDFPSSMKNPNSLTISLNGTSQGAYDGSAAKSINVTPSSIGAATSGHTHNYAGSSSAGGAATKANGIVVSDTRNDNSAPKDAAFDKNMLTADFKFSNKIGSPTGFQGACCGVLSLAPWSDSSGGHGYQLAFGYASTGHPRLALRGSDLSATAWNSWYKIYTSDDKPTLSELGAAAASHTHTKSQITDFPSSMPASDVYSWAKQSSKPRYTISEVSGNLPASRISGTIAAANLPSYVDDVLEYDSFSEFPTTGASGKIYTALDTNKIYRWGGSAYVVISETIALGTTHSTAGYGNESRAAYNHSTSTGNPHNTTKADLGLGNVENKSSATIRGELTSANVTTALGYTPPRTDTNTHYTTRIVAGAANGTANAATTNGNTHINVTDNNTFRSGVVIKGTGATSVTSDASGNITVHSTDTDTWRPIQNNLTSTATSQSLSAAQGKVLNDKFSSYVPTSRTVNNKALSSNITLSAGDVGAAPASHTHDSRYYTEGEIDTQLKAKAANDIITISSTRPTSNTCKIWFKI